MDRKEKLSNSRVGKVLFWLSIIFCFIGIIPLSGSVISVLGASGMMIACLLYGKRRMDIDSINYMTKVFLYASVIAALISSSFILLFIQKEKFQSILMAISSGIASCGLILLARAKFEFVETISNTWFIIMEIICIIVVPSLVAALGTIVMIIVAIIITIIIIILLINGSIKGLSFLKRSIDQTEISNKDK